MKYLRIIFALGLCVWWILVTPSFYQKGGFGPELQIVLQTIFTFAAIGAIMVYGQAGSIEVVFASFILTGISLFFTTLILMPAIVETIYGDATWHLWDRKQRVRINVLYASINLGLFWLLSLLYLQVRRGVMRKKE